MSVDIYKIHELIQFLKSKKLYLTKDRGQNFLIRKEILQKMSDCLLKENPVLEIGPGIGHLSRILSQDHNKLTLVELDKGFVEVLKEALPSDTTIIHKDFLKYSLRESEKKYQIIGNIPYNITSKILIALLKQNQKIEHFFLLMQKEAAQRLLSSPGNKNYAISSILVSFYCSDAKSLFELDAECFFPAPNVQSAFVQFKPNGKPWNEEFYIFLQKCFISRRKTIYNSLKKAYPKELILSCLKDLSLKEQERAEKLDSQTLFSLFESLSSGAENKTTDS